MADRSSGMLLVKLGGSLLTDKERPDTVRGEVVDRLAGEIARARRAGVELVLGHGSGSFGHAAATRHGLAAGDGPGTATAAGVVAVRERAAELHRLVVSALEAAGALPFSISPSSAAVAAGGRLVELAIEPLERALALGLLPVVYGDVVLDRERGAVVCSTETVLAAVVERSKERRVTGAVWVGATEGLLDRRGRLVPTVDLRRPDEALTAAGPAAGSDVTGGMRHRLEAVLALARAGVPSLLLDGTVPGRLEAALVGEEVLGTRIGAAGGSSQPTGRGE